MVLKFQILEGDGAPVIPLAQLLAGAITADRMWYVEPRDQGLAPAARARAFEGIGYMRSDSPLVYAFSGAKAVNFRTAHVALTTLCSLRPDPRPLYYFHTSPRLPDGTLTVRVYDEAGRQLSDDVWQYEPQTATSNARIYVEEAGHYKVVYSNTSGFALGEWLRLEPVIITWPRDAAGYGAGMMRLSTTDSNGERTVEGRIDSIPAAKLLTLTCETAGAEAALVDGGADFTLTLYEGGVSVATVTINKTSNYLLSDLKQTIERNSGWHARLLAPRHTALCTFGSGSATWSFLVPQTRTTIDSVTGLTLTGRCVFYKTSVLRPFEVRLPLYAAETSWYPRVTTGHFFTSEKISDDTAAVLGAAIGKNIQTGVTAEWGIDPLTDSRRDEPSQTGQLLLSSGRTTDFYGSIRGNGVLRTTARLETLSPVGDGGTRWKASSRLIRRVLETWVGSSRYASPEGLFASIDHIEGTFVTHASLEEPPRIKYEYFDDCLQLASWRNPFTGLSETVELNPRLQAEGDRWKSQLVVMTPVRLTVTTTSGTYWTLTNPAPLRLVPTDDPYTDERSLDGHWSTKLPAGTLGKAVQLPWRVLAILHCRPDFGPSQTPVLDLRRQGGELLEDLTPALAGKLNGATKGWDQLTQRHGWQVNQSLVIWLPASLKQRYSEAEVRRRVLAVLPVATFFTIQWY